MMLDTRRRTRRWLLLAGLPLALVALALQWKVAAMVGHDRDGRADYAAGSYADAQDAFASNQSLNVLQAWISPYDDGTARYRLADFAGAVRLLEDALGAAPSEHECRVRINLALAHEAVGDEAAAGEDPGTALAHWQDGVDVLEAGGCLVVRDKSGSGIGSASLAQAEDARAVHERLGDKLLPDRDPAADDAASRARAKLLEERNEQAERDRRKVEQKKEDQADQAQPPPAGPAPDEGDRPTYHW